MDSTNQVSCFIAVLSVNIQRGIWAYNILTYANVLKFDPILNVNYSRCFCFKEAAIKVLVWVYLLYVDSDDNGVPHGRNL